MSARPILTCCRCGSNQLEHAIHPGPDHPGAEDEVVCKRCHARFAHDDPDAAADAQFGKDVDSALSRVRDVNRRFPHR